MRIDLHDGFHLSPVRDGDQPALIEHLNDKDTTDCLLVIPYPYTQEHADFWINSRMEAARNEPRPSYFALRRADGFLIGGIGLRLNGDTGRHRAELGYWISKDYRGRGLTTAAVHAISLYGFRDLGLRRIEATSFAHNLASHRVLEKAGYTREGFLAAYHIKNGALIDAYMFALIAPGKASPS